jgi:hypothetical protein
VTDDKDFKRLVRARMAETGLSYTQAHAALSPQRAGTDGGGLPRDARIFVTGHRGLVGSALVRRLEALGHTRILTATRDQLDLRDQAAVNYWFRANRPDYVFLVAGTVGGIMANATRPAEFLYDNMLIHGTVVHASHEHGVRRLLYLGSSCVYPRDATQPITEDQLLTGPLEPTNEAYAVAKIAGVKLCQAYRAQYGDDFVAAMPTNVYGPNDNFDDVGGHLVPALMQRFHEAERAGASPVTVWGTGAAPPRAGPRRRPGVRLPAADGPRRPAGPGQRRHRDRPHGPGDRRGGPGRRPPGGDPGVRPHQAGRHAPQGPRCHPDPGPRLAADDGPPHRPPVHLRLVPGGRPHPRPGNHVRRVTPVSPAGGEGPCMLLAPGRGDHGASRRPARRILNHWWP